MFTGIIEEIGVVTSHVAKSSQKKITISARKTLSDIKIGDSVSVDGVCLTVTEKGKNHFSVEAVAETLSLSTLNSLQVGRRVNLERALSVVERIGGHIVTGHIDGIGILKAKIEKGGHFDYEIEFPAGVSRYMANKGSIAVDGVSLTIAGCDRNRVRVSIIPHTLKNTTLGDKKVGDKLNLELDILAKYVESLFKNEKSQGVTEEMMSRVGFIPIGIVEN